MPKENDGFVYLFHNNKIDEFPIDNSKVLISIFLCDLNNEYDFVWKFNINEANEGILAWFSSNGKGEMIVKKFDSKKYLKNIHNQLIGRLQTIMGNKLIYQGAKNVG